MSQYINKIRTDAGDLQINYNALANLPTISNPNLLINGDFRNPVNQRGQVSYAGGATKQYTIDRWCMGDSDYGRSVSVVDGGVQIKNTNDQYVSTFQQIFEKPLSKSTYTASVKVKSITGENPTLQCIGSKGSTQIAMTVGVNSLTLTDATIDGVVVYLSPSSTIVLEWAKLEVGTVATEFSPRSYVEELMECRRYFRRYNTPLLSLQYYANQYYGFYFDYPMRADPTFSNLRMLSTDGANTSIGMSAETTLGGVKKVFAIDSYTASSAILESIDLDAEVY